MFFHREEYRISYSMDRWHCDREISFTKYATCDSWRKAIFDAVYQIPPNDYRKPSLKFENLHRCNSAIHKFYPLSFHVLNFEDVDPEDFQFINCFWQLPCDTLILPKNIPSLDLRSLDGSPIRNVILPYFHFVPISPYIDTLYSDPIQLEHKIEFWIPHSLRNQYARDPAWSSIRFILPNERIYSAL